MYAPVTAATLPASALCPTGKRSLCLATSAAEVSSSSTDSATTATPSSVRASSARETAASCALQYGHQDPRKIRTTPYEPARLSGSEIVPPPTAGTSSGGNGWPLRSRDIGILPEIRR